MKKAILLSSLISLLVFTGCFGGGDNAGQTADLKNFKTYNASTFSISVPNSWEIIEAKDFSKEIPIETQVIFRNNIKSDVFTENANVTKKILKTGMSSVDFAKSEILENQKSLVNYKEISRDTEFNVLIGGKMNKSMLIMFEGKESAQDPLIRLIQVYAVNGVDAYTATAAYRSDADGVTTENAKNIVKSFKVN
ncbi:hypothetical protein JW911_02615 [Candidatus Peregrinibacteria bacterium]|nr:hypothetical protein [Candidatus Peregrinibacteria bacterium]